MTDKLYHPIGEVAEMLQVNPSLLRYYETEFPTLRPHKNKKGNRFYTDSDIDLLRQILHLTRDCGYTLDGAREQLRLDNKLDDKMQIIRTLTETRQFLADLKEFL
jgi:DNA-binding transcriptional MerR regulator